MEHGASVAVGDIVRHKKHGIGVVQQRHDELRFDVLFLRGRASVMATRIQYVASPSQVLAALALNSPLDGDMVTVGFIYLRLPNKRLHTPAAMYFANAEVTPEFKGYLTSLGPTRGDMVRARIAQADVSIETPRILRGAARKPCETVGDRIARVNANLALVGDPPLTEGQVRRLHEPYMNKCWSCRSPVTSEHSIPCPRCLWYVCMCGACKTVRYTGCPVV